VIDIREKPVWLLTAYELDLLDPQERQWAVNHAAYLCETGTVAMLSANPPGTTYQTVWDGHLGWKLEPVCRCDPAKRAEREFVKAYLEDASA
jgi:hypothetical protein